MSDREQILQASPGADTATPAISDAIARLMANPELLASVASAIGLPASPAIGAQNETAHPPSDEEKSEALPTAAPSAGLGDLGNTVATLAPLLSGLSGKGGGKSAPDDPRACLLRALKPYVNPRRGEAIDTIIQLSRVSEVMKKLNEKGG